MLSRAGKEMTKAKRSVRIPRAPSIKRNTRPTFTTRTTRITVGENDIIEFM